MRSVLTLAPASLPRIATVDERYQSYNVEMAEVIGGNFWKPYDALDVGAQPAISDPSSSTVEMTQIGQGSAMFEARPPADLTKSRLRTLAKALGPAYVRVSGSWANSAYFHDSDDPPLPVPPEGFQGVLTRSQWAGVVAFARAVDARIVSSFAVSQGVRDASGVWTPEQARRLLAYTRSLGGDLAAAEPFNEPNIAEVGGAPGGYNAGTFARDVDVFQRFATSAAPDMLVAGPGSVGEGIALIPASMAMLKSEDLLAAAPPPRFDVFSYHFYGAVSRRCGSMGQALTTSPDAALSEEWLSRTDQVCAYYEGLRDRFQPGRPMWLTETADAACGGNPWAPTFLDSFRYLDQLGRLAKRGVQAVFHNTLASSDYGMLDQTTLEPGPTFGQRFCGAGTWAQPSSTPQCPNLTSISTRIACAASPAAWRYWR